jgi:hypothetical protein
MNLFYFLQTVSKRPNLAFKGQMATLFETEKEQKGGGRGEWRRKWE